MLDHPEADALRSVSWPEQTPYKMWRLADGYLVPLLEIEGVDEAHSRPRQALPEVWWQNGYVDAVRPSTMLGFRSMTGRGCSRSSSRIRASRSTTQRGCARQRSSCSAEWKDEMNESRDPDIQPERTAPSMFDLTGRVAIITGGAGMLGLRYAEAIAEAGGIPVLADLRPDAIDAALKRIEENTGVEGFGVRVDIAEKSDIDSLVQRVRDRFGRIDILINNAALTVKGGSEAMEGYFAPFEDYPLDLWQRALDVNLTGRSS